MTDTDRGDTNPDSQPLQAPDDDCSDIEQAVAARSDAVARGEGGPEPEQFTAPGDYDGNSGTGGVVKNQDETAQ